MNQFSNKRLFAFGCSYTQWIWPTYADLVGTNFKEYYSFGRSGSDNTYSCNKLIETHEFFKLDPKTDFVIFGVTGFGRYSYWLADKNWTAEGDYIFDATDLMSNYDKLPLFKENYFNPIWAVYRSVLAIKNCKFFLQALKIPHIIYPAIDNIQFIINNRIYDKLDCNKNFKTYSKLKAKELIKYYDIQTSIDEHIVNTQKNYEGVIIDGINDAHPTTNIYYDYLKTYTPFFDNDKLEELSNMFSKNKWNRQELNDLMKNKYTDIYRKTDIENGLYLESHSEEHSWLKNTRKLLGI
jgi:hypothetical protein